MKSRSFIWVLFSFILTTSILVEAKDRKSSTKKKNDCQLISSGAAISKAKARTGGKVVGVKLNRKGNKSTYKVRVLVDKKRVKNITVKACR